MKENYTQSMINVEYRVYGMDILVSGVMSLLSKDLLSRNCEIKFYSVHKYTDITKSC